MNIKELAKKLNLSITTISRALGGYSDVSEKTRARIKLYAKKYNYSPSPFASRLASGKSNIVGVVVQDYGISLNSQLNFLQFLSAMSSKLIEKNFQFSMLFANSQKEELKAYEKLINIEKVDRIIINNTKKNDERIKYFKKHKIDFVSWGRANNSNNFSWVDLDNELSAVMIVDYLVSKGHKNIGYINVTESYNFAAQRKKGYLNSLKKFKIKFNKNYYTTVKYGNSELHRKVIKNMLENHPEITAIICSTETMAIGAVNAIKDLNRVIGKDISVIGYDGPVVSSIASPITAVSHPIKELGNEAINILIENIRNKSNNRFFLAKPLLSLVK